MRIGSLIYFYSFLWFVSTPWMLYSYFLFWSTLIFYFDQLLFNKYCQPNPFEEQYSDSNRDEAKQYPINENKEINYNSSVYYLKSKVSELNKTNKNSIRFKKVWIEKTKETHFDRDNFSTRTMPSSPNNNIRKKKADKLKLKKGLKYVWHFVICKLCFLIKFLKMNHLIWRLVIFINTSILAKMNFFKFASTPTSANFK